MIVDIDKLFFSYLEQRYLAVNDMSHFIYQ